ncbi:MAG: hypothetical protein LBG92_03625 [Prevotellaceae bacterium]|jgi:hypothetical protein|nr:hypothetical protein [Prevotellaceae bacterium]
MIYSFIITEQKSFIREYHIPCEYSLYDFKRFIENDLDFDDSQHGAFFLLDDRNKKTECYSLFDDTGNGTMDSVTLEDLSRKKKLKKLLYTFDFFNNRSLLMDFMGEVEALPRTSYPIVVQSKGKPPGQFSENPPEDEIPDIATDEDEDSDSYYDEDEM